MKSMKNPKRTVEFQIVTLRQVSAPGIVNDHDCPELRSLYYGLNFPSILAPFPGPFGKKEVHCALLVSIAALKKSETLEQGLQPVFCVPALEKVFPDRLRYEHGREEQAERRQEVEVIECDYARAVNRTPRRPHP
jgi:hypothetical protein